MSDNKANEAQCQKIAPSKETLDAIKRLNAGRGKRMSLIDFFKWQLKLYPNHAPHINIWIESLDHREKLIGSPTMSKNLQLYNIGYEEKEKQVIKIYNLTKQELDNYWWNIVKISRNEKLEGRFKDHSLDDGEQYPQSLKEYRSFIVRRDVGYKRRKVKNPLEKSRQIVCLYTLKDGKLKLCNIGLQDDVYEG